LRMIKARILEFDRLIMAWHRSNAASKRLDEIPGVGPALAMQAGSDDLEIIGLALLYPALEWSVRAPGHHGYPRASVLIRV